MSPSHSDREAFERLSEALEAILEGFKAQSTCTAASEKRLADVEKEMLLIKTLLTGLQEDIVDLVKLMRGNGKEGLATRVALLEQSKKTGTTQKLLFATLLAATLTLIGTVVAAVIGKI